MYHTGLLLCIFGVLQGGLVIICYCDHPLGTACISSSVYIPGSYYAPCATRMDHALIFEIV